MAEVVALVELARKCFPDLTASEAKFLEATAMGRLALLSAGDEANSDPGQAAGWGANRSLRAAVVTWVCTDAQAARHVTHRGIQLQGARLDGPIDLDFAKIEFPVVLQKCALPAGVTIKHAHVSHLSLAGSQVAHIAADGTEIRGDLLLGESFKAGGEVRLQGMEIGGNLECDGGEFSNAAGPAIRADLINVHGSIYLRNAFKATGQVRLIGGTIGGSLDCLGAALSNPQKEALNAESATVHGNVFLNRGFTADGEVSLANANIDKDLDCKGGTFGIQVKPDAGPDDARYALNANGANINGDILLRDGFNSQGEVQIINTEIAGNLECINGHFVNPGQSALSGDGISVRGDVHLSEECTVEGEVRLLGATIGGDLNCTKGSFRAPGGNPLFADGIKVRGNVFLSDGFVADGNVRLLGAEISGDLDCESCELTNPQGDTLSADRVVVNGDVFLRKGFHSIGRVSFAGAKAGGRLSITGATVDENWVLDLRRASVGTLADDEGSWPHSGQLYLEGFTYHALDDDAPKDAGRRLKWLGLLPSNRFRPQPYEQLAAVLKSGGYEEDAKAVLIGMNEDRVRLTRHEMGRLRRLWYWLIKWTIAYGHRPGRAFWWSALVVTLGMLAFWAGYQDNLMVYSGKAELMKLTGDDFCPFAYSLDVFLPVVDLLQAPDWRPEADAGGQLLDLGGWRLHTGGVLLFWMWTEILAGWLLVTLLIAGLTGLVRR